MLARHNYLRQFHGSSVPMTWNATLAAAAQTEVNTCVFQHTVNNPYGENLAGMDRTGGYTAPELVVSVDEWYGEISSYDFSNPGFSVRSTFFPLPFSSQLTHVVCNRPLHAARVVELHRIGMRVAGLHVVPWAVFRGVRVFASRQYRKCGILPGECVATGCECG
jgi:Cysteine-rich secretory protein family